MLVHGRHHFVSRMWSGHRQDLGVRLLDDIAFGAEAARHDHSAVFSKGFADRLERLFHRRIDEPTGVYDDEIGILVTR